MFVLPNSAPDSFTPKNLNLVALGQPEAEGAEEVVEGGAEGVEEAEATVLVGGGVALAVPTRHWE